MGGKAKPTTRESNVLKGLAAGWIAAMVSLVLGSGILTILILENAVDWKSINYGVMIVLLVTAYIGAAVSANKAGTKRLPVCILSGIILLLMLSGITLILFNGQFEGYLMAALLIAGGSACAALVHCAEKRSRPRAGRKKRL